VGSDGFPARIQYLLNFINPLPPWTGIENVIGVKAKPVKKMTGHLVAPTNKVVDSGVGVESQKTVFWMKSEKLF